MLTMRRRARASLDRSPSLALSRAIATGAGARLARRSIAPCRRNGAASMVTTFERETGIKVSMTRKSSGEFYAQLKAEAANPRGDIWWGGTGDPHLQAAEEGLTHRIQIADEQGVAGLGAATSGSSRRSAPSASMPARSATATTPSFMKKKGGAEPKCWADLLDPRFKDEVQVADPNSSGTSYTMLATIVQLMGEDKAFDYLKKLHKNINQYTKSGAAPAKAASLGEIADRHHLPARRGRDGGAGRAGEDRVAVRRHRLRDRLDVDHQGRAQSRECQEVVRLGADRRRAEHRRRRPSLYQVPSNKDAVPPEKSPKLAEIKLIDYDFAKYGSSAERRRLLSKWDNEVKNLPK